MSGVNTFHFDTDLTVNVLNIKLQVNIDKCTIPYRI